MSPRPTALIAEDEPLLAAHLRAELQRCWPDLDVVTQVGDGLQALGQTLERRPSVCFLDIRMPGMTGLEVAQALAEEWPDDPSSPAPLLVFVTAYDQHAVQAFDLQAVDYLLKPVNPARLKTCVQRLQDTLARRSATAGKAQQADENGASELQTLARKLDALLRAGDGANLGARTPKLELIAAQNGAVVEMVPVDDVCYFEAADKYVRVLTASREYLIRMSLRELMPQLDEQRFWQIHRSVVVQARFITQAVRDEAGKTTVSLRHRPERLPVSRLHAHLFKGL